MLNCIATQYFFYGFFPSSNNNQNTSFRWPALFRKDVFELLFNGG